MLEKRLSNRNSKGIAHPSIRVPIHIPVRFSDFEDHTLNISVGGMFIRTDHYLRPGSDLKLEFSLEGSEKIVAHGRVVWATEGVAGNHCSFARGLGIQFVKLPKPAYVLLNNLSAQFAGFP